MKTKGLGKLLAAATLVVGAASIGIAETTPISSPARIIDGDTIRVGSERIRLINIDTPEEFHPHCQAEWIVAHNATQRLGELLGLRGVREGVPTRIEIERHGVDRFGRTLAYVRADGVDVGEVLLDEGLALRWAPGRAAKLARLQVWCGPAAQLN